jgi:hypothetical protein
MVSGVDLTLGIGLELDPRESTRGSNSKFLADWGINQRLKPSLPEGGA